MVNPILPGQRNILLHEAYMLRAIYPALYDFLVQRDRLLQRTLQCIPDPHDPEAWTSRADLELSIAQLKKLPPGLGVLAGEGEKSA